MPHAVCPGCGCACDDIELSIEEDRITHAKKTCPLGEKWFRDQRPVLTSDPTAIATAAGLLHRADSPLIFGLGQTTCEAQSEAIALAELVGGTIDTETSLTHGPMEMAAQLGGKVTCTLGEIKNRADLIVYWGANPVETHPRHFERYTVNPTGKFRPKRTLVVVDVRETATTAAADVFLRIRPNTDFEALTILRAILKGSRFDAAKLAATGLTLAQLRDLADRMAAARYGAFFIGMGLLQTPGRFMNAAAATALVVEMNARTRFISMPMRRAGNVSGADAVFTYTAGYPFGVNFSRGYPRYNPGEFTAAEMLTRGEVDAALIVGADSLARLPQAARERLARIPTIILDPNPSADVGKVRIATGVPGVTAGGTVYRMDKVPLTLRPPLAATAPTDEAVLRQIKDAVVAMGVASPTAAAILPAAN